MDDLPLRWLDRFNGPLPGKHWVGGHANTSLEAVIGLDAGLHIEFKAGTEYASAGLVTRMPVVGDFDARVHFTVANPGAGTTFELAAISVDPPGQSALEQAAANSFTRSRVYDVHGVPPYVSSEYDEDDGWRIGWNRGSAATEPGDDGKPRSDNHFNRYGHSTALAAALPVEGWLRLVRTGTHWATYRLDGEGLWVVTGEARHMNLPDPVFLRLVAKHWVKRSEGATAAPANRISFHAFELRGAMPAAGAVATVIQVGPLPLQRRPFTPLPAEVALVQELRGCRSCAAFGSENLYGAFPQVDMTRADDVGKTTVLGFGPPEPAALYGCRKAPIMLIGINPNLPGHFVFPRAADGDKWRSGSYRLVPFFASDVAYAQHYRFGPEPAARVVDAAVLDGLLRVEARSLLIADKAGALVGGNGAGAGSYRAVGKRGARLELQFDDGSNQVHDLSWRQDENLAVVRRRFAAGEIIAGHLDASVVGRSLRAEAAPDLDGYHVRASTLLQHIGQSFPQSALSIGEDLSLHDAVACASPRWDATEMPLEAIRANCVHDRRWLHRQVEQSAPEVIILAGRTALNLFADPAFGTLSTPLASLPLQAGGREGLFFQVATGGLWWTYRVGPQVRTVRIVVAPHLSYSDNFRPHAYFGPTPWTAFLATHAAAAAWLRQDGRIAPVFDSEDVMVVLGGVDDPAWNALTQIDPGALAALQACWIDPYTSLSSAAATELQRLGVGLDDQGHLRRSAGPCSYCDNAQWKFDGGCRYGVSAG